MPSMSAVGKRRPTSTTTRRSSYSNTVMFLPISPSPPRGMTRRGLATSGARVSRGETLDGTGAGRGQHAMAFEHGPDDADLRTVELDIGQAWRAVLEHAHELQRRLDAAGGRGDGKVTVDVAQRRVDLVAALGLVDHPPHLLS